MKRLFRMITSKQVVSQICPGDWFFSLDLKDSYIHIQIAPHHRRFLRFAFEGVAYQYLILPFGLAPSVLAETSSSSTCLASWTPPCQGEPDAPPTNGSGNMGNLRQARVRSLRLRRQPSLPNLFFEGQGCVGPRLARPPHLYFSPDRPDPAGTKPPLSGDRNDLAPPARTMGATSLASQLSRWIIDAIMIAYSSLGQQCPMGVRAHSTRGIASSWAWSSGVSIAEICAVAGWEEVVRNLDFLCCEMLTCNCK